MPSSHSPYRQVFANDYSAYTETDQRIAVGSTLSVAGAFLVLTRERFKFNPDVSIPWVWVPGTNTPHIEDPLKSSITIEVSLRDNVSDKDKRPAIYLERGAVTTQQEMLDNKVGEMRQSGKKGHYSSVYCPWTLVCQSHDKGVAEVLGNIMFEWFLYNKNTFKKYFQFRELGPFQLGPELPSQKQTGIWECRVDFRAAWEHRWSDSPISIPLTELTLSIIGTDDPTVRLSELSPTDDLLATITQISLHHGWPAM